jgi:alkanesulfonate monooxygenase SsuD/methylene tetrahydromethanopterin reductase-like flavin-dependent oxidoreductase (luciferase family)
MEYPRFFEDNAFIANKISKLKDQIAANGRNPSMVKIMMAITPIVAPSEKEALEKEAWFKQFDSPEGHLALFGGHTGIDLSGLDYDTSIEDINLEGMQHIALKWKGKTIKQFLSQRPPTCVGSTKQVVDRMEELASCGVDGFVVHPMIQPQSHEDLVDFIIPELQKRNLFRTKYEHNTLRGHLLGSKDSLSNSDHPSAKFRV